jgi:hypothetical protein
MQVSTTGQLDTIFESQESEIELIRKENECMLEGKPVRAVVGDLHLTHAKEHKTVINDPMLRSLVAQGDPMAQQVVGAVLAHINEHEMMHAQQTPFFTMMSGEPPPPQMMPPPPPGPGGPPPPPGPMPEGPPLESIEAGPPAIASAPPPAELPPELSNANFPAMV